MGHYECSDCEQDILLSFVDSGHYQVLYVTPEYVDHGPDFLSRIHQSSGKKSPTY